MANPIRKPDEPAQSGQEQETHEAEREQVHELSAPKGAVVYGAIHQEGEDELSRSTSALAWSGLAAGLSMGFSFAVEAMLAHGLPDRPWRPLIAKLGYSVGFLIVVLGRQQLFTENTLTVILPLLRRRERAVLRDVLRLWSAVLLANIVGALVFALALARTPAFPPEMADTFSRLGAEALKSPALTVFVRGIFAGWLIALMVWLLPFAETSRVWVIVIVTYVIGLGGFAHVIAGSVETLYMVVTGQRTVADYVLGFFLPALAGNIIGGVSLVAALAHAQFIAASNDGEDQMPSGQ
jgi:formate/nitrite transporter FocA (FNT family)